MNLQKSSRDIKDAHPRMQKVWAHLQKRWPIVYPFGPKLVLAEVYRAIALQRAYYAQGRESLALVNELRKVVGLPAIKAEENRIITNSVPGDSKHNIHPSPAIDVMLYYDNKPVNELEWYRRMYLIAREADEKLRWGGDWDGDGRSDDQKLIDGPHLELI